MWTRESLRGQVVVLLLSMAALVLVVAGVGAVAVASLTDDVQVVVKDLRPTAYANIALRKDMDQALGNMRGWALWRDGQMLDDYETSAHRALDRADRLETLTAGDEQVQDLARDEAGAVRSWVAYANVWLAHQTGHAPTEYDKRGDGKFRRFVALNNDLSWRLNEAVDTRGVEARGRSRAVVVFVTLVSVVGLGLMVLVGWRIVRRLGRRLHDIEAGVARLTAGDLSARVSTDGPREIRGVASALNTLAEENQRAREMEEQVVSQLRRLDRAKDDFVSTVSHELRTPLTSIAGYVELFEDGLGDDLAPQQRAMLGAIRRNVGRLRSLIEDLLTLSQVEADAFRTSFDLVDLTQIASAAAREVEQRAARAEVNVRECLPKGPVLVRGDSGQLLRATLNLLSNGVKFSSRGGDLVLGLARSDGHAVVSVVDHGIGIPPEELPTVGTRFFRASNAVESEITGTGLGLRIVQTIVHNHGGRFELEPGEGRGTVARLVVPLADERDAGNSRPLQDITKG